MAHHEPAEHVSPDPEYAETPPGSTYEHTDAYVWIIVKFLWWLAVSAVVIHVGLGVLYQLMIQQALETGQQPYPLATAEQRLPPTPRLQQFPHNDLYQFRLGEESLLHGYGWMNRNAGVAHIPIEDAKRLVRERGLLPSREDSQAPATATSALMPSDASAGRTMEQRRQ